MGGGRGLYHFKMSKKMAEMSKMSKMKLKCQHARGNVQLVFVVAILLCNWGSGGA